MRAVNQTMHADSRPRFRVPVEVIPLAGAFLAISFAFGVLARESDLSLGLTVLMSGFVYAGSSQVVALGLLATAQPAWLIVLVTLLINSRLLLMSSVMAQPSMHWNRFVRWVFAATLTDETFALLLRPDGGIGTPGRAMWIQLGAYVAWVSGSAAGFILGGNSAQLRGLGLDFALIAMMLAVLVLQIRDRRGVAVAMVAGAIALVATQWGWSWAAPLLAAFIAPAVGIWMEKRWTRS
jgi:4-azaleucine resistance transporter AzlC